MSELAIGNVTPEKIRHGLLLGVSSLALLAQLCSANAVGAEEVGDRPSVWIELGGQLERLEGGQELFAPPFLNSLDGLPFTSPLKVQQPPRYANGGEIGATFSPHDSPWAFSASIRYGRSNGKKDVHEQTSNPTMTKLCLNSAICYVLSQFPLQVIAPHPDKANSLSTTFEQRESHAVVDFAAGRDVGLGLFGSKTESALNVGVRFAQFASRTTVSMDAIPDRYVPNIIFAPKYNHRYDASAEMARSFSGIGPSLSLTESTLLAGEPEQGRFLLDWGVNASVLFGRQKVVTHHQTTGRYYRVVGLGPFARNPFYSHYQTGGGRSDARSIVVPNVGGFASVSLKFPNAKISLGYRADFFFGAIDGGIDTRQTKNIGFHGPFATISIGLGG